MNFLKSIREGRFHDREVLITNKKKISLPLYFWTVPSTLQALDKEMAVKWRQTLRNAQTNVKVADFTWSV